MARMLFIGVGNDHRRDDAAGLAVARSLRLIASPAFTVVEHAGDLTALLDLWESRDCVYVADAMRSGDPPGTVHRYEWPSVTLPAAAFRSMTHEVGLREVLELGRALGRLPARLVLFGIVGANFDHGEGLSPAVAATVGRVARRLGNGDTPDFVMTRPSLIRFSRHTKSGVSPFPLIFIRMLHFKT